MMVSWEFGIRKAKSILKQIQAFCKVVPLVYLPSHDPQSGKRLQKLICTKIKD